jgi:hypothetical protein
LMQRIAQFKDELKKKVMDSVSEVEALSKK